MNYPSKKRKCTSTKKKAKQAAKAARTREKKTYTIEHIREGLKGMILGKSRRTMADLTKVPATNLRRYFIDLVGRPPNKLKPLNAIEMQSFLDLAKSFVPKGNGDHARYFTPDEEELFVITIEEAAAAAFPYDSQILERMASKCGQLVYGEDFKVGVSWRRGFERRWKARLTKVKCGSICKSRGKKATVEVRDAVFKKFENFLKSLIDDGKFTETQARNLAAHICNADELGGDERGKSKAGVYTGRNAASASWRTINLGGDHEPFHVTVMLTSIASGLIAKAVQIIHSCPGVQNPRMSSVLLEHLPDHWSCRRTSSGSQTRITFEDWCKYFVRTMEQDGYGNIHNHPMILLIDGHTSRWTYNGLNTLIAAGFYPFFLASHTSAWDQPNGGFCFCGFCF